MLNKKWRSILSRPEFPVLFFFFSLFLVVIPFQKDTNRMCEISTFFYLFLAWAMITLVLFLMSRESSAADDRKDASR